MTWDDFDHNVCGNLTVQRIDRITDAVDLGHAKAERI